MKRRTARLLLTLVLAVLTPSGLLVGCNSSPSAGPSTRPSSPAATPTAHPDPHRRATSQAPAPKTTQSPSPHRPRHTTTPLPRTTAGLLTGIVHAVEAKDRSGFQALVSDRDPGFRGTAGMIFDNLVAIHPANLALRATGNRRDLSTARATSLGHDSYAAEVRVSWSVPGDRAPSSQRVWMTVVRSASGVRWGGVADGPGNQRRTPLWWLEPVHYGHSGAATVITGAQVNTSTWLSAANTAVRQDAPRLPGSRWNHELVVIVPSNERLMEQSLGVGQGTDSALAAITWPDGTTAASAPDRIMINPAGQPSALSTAIVLSHETVHVATRSPTSRAPSWLVEGFADDIAYRSYPQGSRPAAESLLAEVKRNGPPTTLPGESDFSVSHRDLNRSYAQAWLACRYLAERFGDRKLWRFYQAVDTSRDGSITGPLHSVFGIDQHQFVSGWQNYLRSAAKTGRI